MGTGGQALAICWVIARLIVVHTVVIRNQGPSEGGFIGIYALPKIWPSKLLRNNDVKTISELIPQ